MQYTHTQYEIPSEYVQLIRKLCKQVLLKEKLDAKECSEVSHIVAGSHYEKAVDDLKDYVRASMGLPPVVRS